jgi:hypothetical protein
VAALAAYRSGVFMSAVDIVGPQAVPQLQAQVEQIIAEARKQGASACEVAVSVEQGLSTTVRQGEVETVEFNRDQGLVSPCMLVSARALPAPPPAARPPFGKPSPLRWRLLSMPPKTSAPAWPMRV